MRNAIKFYYDIDVERLHNIKNGFLFDKYFLKELKSNIDLNLYNYFINNNIYIYRMIKNRNNEFITLIDKKKYILLYTDKKDDITFDSINTFFKEINIDIKSDWALLWENKVDYYEKQILRINNKSILEIFPYYIGLSENAIRVYKEANSTNIRKGITHRRLDNNLDLYSPDNIIVDYYVRDLAEYIKVSFFYDKLDLNILKKFFESVYLSSDDYIILFARLLFPSYFFDCIENNDDIVIYSSKINQYERLLNLLYNLFKFKGNIPNIDWLIKKI